MTDTQSYNLAPIHAISVQHVAEVWNVVASYNLKHILHGGHGIESIPFDYCCQQHQDLTFSIIAVNSIKSLPFDYCCLVSIQLILKSFRSCCEVLY